MNKRTVLPDHSDGLTFFNKKTFSTLAGLTFMVLFAMLVVRNASTASSNNYTFPAQATTQWSPYSEWSIQNDSFIGNPYDVIAAATFTHSGSGETHTTYMFYDGNNTWKFRFAGTQLGQWTFTTSSADPELNGQSGLVDVASNNNNNGFVSNNGNKWIHSGTNEAFVPQFVMAAGPHYYYNNASQIDVDIQTFFAGHGFNGFHVPVFCRWVDLDRAQCSQNGSSNPDPRTFQSLELLITKVYAAGGTVHLWTWSDNTDKGNPNYLSGGVNGAIDQRIQRYIAARLGPIPGWTMGYGFDLWEWTNDAQLTQWHDFMQAQMGWDHYLGARASKNRLNQISESLDYSAYEQHKPSYDMYVQTIEERPFKPSFSEDRFRVRDEGRAKDYTMEETSRGMWHSTMAGGVANIWGYLIGASGANDGLIPSAPYPNPEWIKTYSRFFADRFLVDMVRCNQLTSGTCLQVPANTHYVFYQESTASVQMDLSAMAGTQNAVAVDAKGQYAELNIGSLNPANHTWNAPYLSDWAIAVGNFMGTTPPPAPTATNVPPQPTATAVPPQPTATAVPPQPTATAVPPQPTATAVPPQPTSEPPTTCGNKGILFVTGSVPPPIEDQMLIDYLIASGYTVQVIDQRDVQASDATGKHLVMISSTIGTRSLGDKFRDVNVAVMTWEVNLFSSMGFTQSGRRNYGYINGQSQVNIINSTHPLSANLSGTVTMLDTPDQFFWGHPVSSAVEVALNSDASKTLVFAYEAGAEMSGLNAPARRVAFHNANAIDFTVEGWLLFDAAVSWAVGCN